MLRQSQFFRYLSFVLFFGAFTSGLVSIANSELSPALKWLSVAGLLTVSGWISGLAYWGFLP